MEIPLEVQIEFGNERKLYREACSRMQRVNSWYKNLSSPSERDTAMYDLTRAQFSRECKRYKEAEMKFQSHRMNQDNMEKIIARGININEFASQLPGPASKEAQRLENLRDLLDPNNKSDIAKVARDLLEGKIKPILPEDNTQNVKDDIEVPFEN